MNQFRIIAAGVGAVVILALLQTSLFVVQQTEQALVLLLGRVVRVESEPGLNFKIPFFEEVARIDRRVLNVEEVGEEVPTLDQKQLIVDYFARYRIVDPLLFYQTVRTEELMKQRLDQIIVSQLRRVIGNAPMADLLTAKRADMMREITTSVDTAGQRFGIDVLDVRMKRVDLPTQNSEAIFNQMRTQREQEAAEIRSAGERDARTIRAEAEKQQVVIVADAQRQASIQRGAGDGEATRIYNEAFGKDPAFFDFFRSLQAMEAGLPAATTTYVGPASGDFFRFFGKEQGRLDPMDDGGAAAGQ
jgi:membrane protease subunit HflC